MIFPSIAYEHLILTIVDIRLYVSLILLNVLIINRLYIQKGWSKDMMFRNETNIYKHDVSLSHSD